MTYTTHMVSIGIRQFPMGRQRVLPVINLFFFLPKTLVSLSSPRAKRAGPRALGLLLADGTPTGGRGEDFLSRQPDFFTETAVTPERKVEKSFPRWEINRHVEG